MFTLKIKWMRYESDLAGGPSVLADEATYFIAADEVASHGEMNHDEIEQKMSAWESGSYFDYHIGEMTCRLIQTTKGSKDTWYLASLAWLMGPDGKTIERLI